MSEKNNAHNCRVATQTSMGRAKPFVMGRVKERYYDFDGFFTAVKKLEIRSEEEYQKRFHEDPFLPEDPKRVIVDFPGWSKTFELLFNTTA